MGRSLTVLLPNYNTARYLPETIASLLGQTHRDFQLIVLDNVSTDGAAEAAEAIDDPRLRVIRADTHLNMMANWNRAVDLVETPYFALCHSDDIYEPQFIEVVLGILEDHPDAFIAHCKVKTIDQHGLPLDSPAERYKDRFWPPDDPYKRSQRDELAALRRGNYILMPAVIYRADALREIGPFREQFQFAADWDLWLRGVLAGYAIVGTHRRLVRYRRHPEMVTRQTEVSLARYRDELAIPNWVATAAYQAGLADSDTPDYDITVNALLSEFAARLTRGDRQGAATLLDYALTNIPPFPGSAKALAARAAYRCGRLGGAGLKALESLYLRMPR